MSLNVADLFATLSLDPTTYEKGLKGASKTASKEGKHGAQLYARAWLGPLKAVGGAAAGLFAVTKVAGFIKDAVAQARDSNKIGAVTAQVIKTTGGAANITAKQVGNLSTSLSMKTGVDDEVIQSGQNMLLTFKNVRNETGKGNDIFNQASGIMTDLSVAMGSDTKSAALQLGKALNDPVKGMTALQRVGVTFDAAQQKQIKGYVKSGDTLKAQKIILKELSSEFGGAAAAAATPAQRLAVVYGNLKENIGNALIPVIDKGETLIVNKVIPAFSDWFGQIDSGTGTVGHIARQIQAFGGVLLTQALAVGRFAVSLGKEALPYVIAFGSKLTAVLLPILRSIVAWVSGKLLPALKSFAEAIGRDVLPLVISLGQFLETRVLPIVMRLGKALGQDLVRDIREVTAFLKEHKTTVQAVVVGLAAMVGAIYLVKGAMTAWTIATNIQKRATELLDAVMDANPIMLIVVALVGLAAGFIYAYKHSETFRNIVKAAMADVMVAVHAFVGFFTKTVPAAFSAVVGFVKKHWYLLPGIIFGPLGLAVGMIIHFRSQIAGFFVSLWHSVSTATSRGITTAINWIAGLPGRAIHALGNVGSTLYSKGSALLGGLKSGAVHGWNVVWKWIKERPTVIGGAALGWSSTLYSKGGALISGLKNGIWNGIKGIGSWIKKNVIDPIVNAVKGFFGIHSPSTVFAGIGGHLIGGLMKGLGQTNGKQIAQKIFGDMPHALGHIVKKGILKVAQLPKKALNAIQGLGGDLAGLVPRRTVQKAGHGSYSGGGAVSGSAAVAQSYAKSILSKYGWGAGEMGALTALWNGESGWNNLAANPTSSAYGIAQFLDSTWGPYGPKTSDYKRQVDYGEHYIKDDYGSPSNALGAWLSRSPHWYDQGGMMKNNSVGINTSGKPEAVLTGAETAQYKALIKRPVPTADEIGQAVARYMQGVKWKADRRGFVEMIAPTPAERRLARGTVGA